MADVTNVQPTYKPPKDLTRNRDATSPYSVISVVFLLLIVVAVFKVLSGSSTAFTFTGFLQSLQNAPHLDPRATGIFDIPNAVSSSVANIPIFGALVQLFVGVFNGIIYAFTGILQVIIYFGWFVGFLFA